MARVSNVWKRFWSDESGHDLIEYALIIALVAIGLVLALSAFRNSIGGIFDDVTTEMGSATVSQYQPVGGTAGG